MPQPPSPAVCAAWIRDHGPAVALTGAGVSTAAGIPDFRGPEGLYATGRYDADTVFRIDAFQRDPEPFYAFTRDFLAILDRVQPTRTHRILSAMEAAGFLEVVVTQNIDPLHEAAGSRNVLAVHGNYWTSHCLACGEAWTFEALRASLARTAGAPRCRCGGCIKPDVVFFGEPVHALPEAQAAVLEAGVLLVLGSSLTVHPAAALPAYAPGPVVVVNRGPVALPPGPDRHFVDADLDSYLGAVADELGLDA
ncbi:MAG: SIR2 family NAD-dependent protein deacylase [Planctomycetota bacterium]